ncbi:MAG: hypothetical protein AAF456_15475 [Planctomycetota bacterium]
MKTKTVLTIAICLSLFATTNFASAQMAGAGYQMPGQPVIIENPGQASSISSPIPGQVGQIQNWNVTPEFAVSQMEACSAGCGPQAIGGDFFRLHSEYTFQMLDFQNRQGDKETILLCNAMANGGQPGVAFGSQFRASALFATTNTTDKFSYLGRFPPDFVGDSATDFRLLQANQSFTVTAAPGVHGYIETLFSDVFTFPSFEQGSYQVRQAYVVFGDFAASPFYAFVGKKNISFGDFGTLSPFTQAVPWHYFAPVAEGAGAGFKNRYVNATVTAINGGRGIRVADSDRIGHLNNFAANILLSSYGNGNTRLDVGAGYLYGTIYDSAVPDHIDPNNTGPRNGAWDVNARLRTGALTLEAEYVQTENPWPATNHEVIAYRTEAALDGQFNGMPARYSVSWSEGIQGDPGTEFEFNRQLVLGLRVQPYQRVFLSAEYVRNTGFAPLINIATVSDIDVVQDSAVLGATIFF